MEALDAIIFVKVLERGYQMLANSSVPLLWDHLDEWDGFPFWDLASWDLKYAFAGVFTAGRVAKMAFDRAGIPAHFVYHNHNNDVRRQCRLVSLPCSACDMRRSRRTRVATSDVGCSHE